MSNSVIVHAFDGDKVVSVDLTPQWSTNNRADTPEQQAITAGNAKYIRDTRPRGVPCPEIPPGFAPPRGWKGCSHGFQAPHLIWPEQPAPPPPPPPKPKRGRPKGSKNKPKLSHASESAVIHDDLVSAAQGISPEQLEKIIAAYEASKKNA